MQNGYHPHQSPVGRGAPEAPGFTEIHPAVRSFVYIYPTGILHSTLPRGEIRQRIEDAVTCDGDRAFVELNVVSADGRVATVDYRESMITAVLDR